MKYSSRFFLYAPLLAFLSLAAWAMAHWWAVASALDKKLTALNNHAVIPGVTLSYASKTISGFPFNIDVVFTGLKLAGAGAHGPFAWTSEHFALHRLTYGREQDIDEAAGRQTLTWTDADGAVHSVSFLPGSLRASIITDDKGLARFDLDMVAVGGKDSSSHPFTIGRAQFHFRRDPDGKDLDLMASADDLAAATGIPALGTHIHILRSYITLSHAASLAPLLNGLQSWPDATAAWQKEGGAVPGQQQIDLAGAPVSAAERAAASAILTPLY